MDRYELTQVGPQPQRSLGMHGGASLRRAATAIGMLNGEFDHTTWNGQRKVMSLLQGSRISETLFHWLVIT